MKPAPLSAEIAVHRFGLGPRPGELSDWGRDARATLLAQIAQAEPLPAALKALPDSRAALARLRDFFRARVAQRGGPQQAGAAGKSGGEPGVEASFRQTFGPALQQEFWTRHALAAETRQPFVERWLRFWSNHFTVSGAKPQVLPLAGAYEREALRPRLFGRFESLLIAAALHPAMLAYLDNDRSLGPDSRAGRRSGRGLNENLAREILELHTLGVDGGYSQADVSALAKVLTGWGIDYRGASGARFYAVRHEPGAHSVLGRRYAEDGADQARAVLRDLAAHPATARHLATKLARHFVAEPPPAALIAALARSFTDSGGDLAVLARTLVTHEAAAVPLMQFRRPEEYLIAVQRLLGAERGFRDPRGLIAAQTQLGQRPFSPPSPQGWSDDPAQWLTPDALAKRLELAQAIAARLRLRAPLALAEAALGAGLPAETRTQLQGAESREQALALLLAAPVMHRR